MRILILGGTAFLGKEIARTALAEGHAVSCVTRGDGREDLLPLGAQAVVLDRESPDSLANLAQTVGRDGGWDVVVDVARDPAFVRRAVAALEPITAHYVFVSTGNVYADHSRPDGDELDGLLPALPEAEEFTPAKYGEAKVACERAVLAAYGTSRSTIVRAGLLSGPGDVTGRSGYWPWRFRHPVREDGSVIVPKAPDQPIQLMDVRDFAAWIVTLCGERTCGIFDGVGPRTTLGDVLSQAQRVAAVAAERAGEPLVGRPQPVSTEWLAARGVQEWMGARSLPLWLADPDWHGFAARSGRKARAAGLRTRPLAETLADALEFEEGRGWEEPRLAGLSDDEERELLGQLGTQRFRPDVD